MKKKPILNRHGIPVLSATKKGSIAQNLSKSREMVEEAAEHDAGGTGTVNDH